MTDSTLRTARGVAAAAAALLFISLFFDWTHVSVTTPAMHISTGTSGWNSLGIGAGIFALALLVYELRRLDAADDSVPLVVLLSLGVLGFTIGRFRDAAEVAVTGVVNVDVGGRTWVAWAGLVFATVAAGAAVAPLVARIAGHGGSHVPAH